MRSVNPMKSFPIPILALGFLTRCSVKEEKSEVEKTPDTGQAFLAENAKKDGIQKNTLE